MLALLVGVYVGPRLRDARVGVLVAVRPLAPGDVITDDDLSLGTRSPDEGRVYAATANGRVAVRAIPKGAAIRITDLGPDLEGTLGSDVTIVPVDTPFSRPIAGVLGVGQTIRVVVRPNNASYRAFQAVVVAVRRPVRERDDGLGLAVAMRRPDANRYLSLRADAEVIVVRDVLTAGGG